MSWPDNEKIKQFFFPEFITISTFDLLNAAHTYYTYMVSPFLLDDTRF